MYLNADIDEPAEEQYAEIDGVDDGECSQVDAAGYSPQVSAGENKERDDVTDDADSDDDGYGDQVNHVNETSEADVARLVVRAAAVPQRVHRRHVPSRRRAAVRQERRRYRGRHLGVESGVASSRAWLSAQSSEWGFIGEAVRCLPRSWLAAAAALLQYKAQRTIRLPQKRYWHRMLTAIATVAYTSCTDRKFVTCSFKIRKKSRFFSNFFKNSLKFV